MKKKQNDSQRNLFQLVAYGDKATIYLYGDISNWDEDVNPREVVSGIRDAESKYKSVEVRINSMGGDVYAGIAIFNALANSKADIKIYVDGIAASMASVIALCGKPVYMSKYARMMIHSIKGGVYGTKDELEAMIDQIQSLENTLSKIYSEKTKLSADEIKEKYFDGKDHWLTADEALSLGFIDGIYDAEAIPEANLTNETIYATFNNRLKSHNISKNMNLDELKKRPQFKSVATDEDVMKVIAHLETEAAKVPQLDQKVGTLEASLKVYEDTAKEAQTAEITALLDAAEKDGRIDAVTRPTFQALLDSDRVNGEAALKALAPKRRVSNELNVPAGSGEGPWQKRMGEIKNKLNK